MKKIILFFLVFILAGFFVSEARAFSISPLKYLLTVAPGENKNLSLKIKNDGQEKKFYALETLGVRQDENGRTILAKGLTAAEKWATAEESVLEVGPGEEKTAVFKINVPQTAAAGSYYIGLAAREMAESGGGDVGLSGQLATIVFLQVSGQANESLGISKWAIGRLTLKKDWLFDLVVKNNGNIETPAVGRIIIRNWRGRIVYDKAVEMGVVLAGASRAFQTKVILAKGDYISGPHWAEMKIVYGRSGQTVSSTYCFWYVSPSMLLAVILILVLAVLISFRYKKHRRFE